jgi:hypothetical protein
MYDYANHGSDWEDVQVICGSTSSFQSPVDLGSNYTEADVKNFLFLFYKKGRSLHFC